MNNNNLRDTKPLIESEQLAFNEEKRTITHYITTETVNRYGYVLKNDGMDATNYRKNAIVLYNHSMSGFFDNPFPQELIIGGNLTLMNDGIGQVAETQFANTPRGNELKEFYKQKLMNGWSVGWNSNNGFIDVDNVPTMANWELLEYSAVIIPANPDAVNKMLSFAQTPSMKRTLSMDLVMLNYKQEFDNEFSTLKESLKNLSDAELSKKDLSDFKNEVKSLIGSTKKPMIDLLYSVTNRLNNLESNLHGQILSKMPNIIDSVVRKYIGKVDD